MKKVAIGLVGSSLDMGMNDSRWSRWRPSVSICQQEDLLISRFHLLHSRRETRLAELLADDIGAVSPETEVLLEPIEFQNPWDFEEVYAKLLDYAAAFKFDQESEEYLIHITTGTHVAQICLFLLTESRRFPGKLLQSSPRGGSGVAGSASVIDLDLSKYDKLAMRFSKELGDDVSFLKTGIETRNAKFNSLIETLERVASRSKDPLLLCGPTGAGKSHLAKRVYELKKSRRKLSGPFVSVNCATIKGEMAMSTLFGHKKGSFTGASSDRKGLLAAANGGVLFLDEIGELGLDEQAMLLRALEERSFLPLGSDVEASSDFQLISGTNRDLSKAVAKGSFRDDLLARINLWTFTLPGLSERVEDIEPNLDFELERLSSSLGRAISINAEARKAFLDFAVSPQAKWTGNFRDLNGAVRRMSTMSESGRITVPAVAAETQRLRELWGSSTGSGAPYALCSCALGEDALSCHDPFDLVQLEKVLELCQASKSLSEAGRRLFPVSRQRKSAPNDADRLRKYLAKFGLAWDSLSRSRIGK